MLNVILYKLPNGARDIITIRNIMEDDADFFKSNKLCVSMEELRDGTFVLYSTTNKDDDEGDDNEEIYIVPGGESCEDAFHNLRIKVEKYL